MSESISPAGPQRSYFDITDQQTLFQWVAQTVQFALVAGGEEEIEPTRIKKIALKRVFEGLPQRVELRDVVKRTFEVALGLGRPGSAVGAEGPQRAAGRAEAETCPGGSAGLPEAIDSETEDSDVVDGFRSNVMNWALMSAAAVLVSLGTPFTHEKLEFVVAQEIVDRIQGNRTNGPSRGDLDSVVRRVIEWGGVRLGV